MDFVERQQNDPNAHDSFPVLPLVLWNRTHWGELIESLSHTRNVCMRDDVKNVFSFSLNEEEVRKMENPQKMHDIHDQSALFGRKYDLVVTLCRIHQTIAPFRDKLEDAVTHQKCLQLSTENINELLYV